ncbi:MULTISPECIES: hypothetical protein [Streptomyces]|uniref:Uncharacterized protein n=2 Tax=Streptomyces TaxID=1883 RepID=A0ABU4JZR5_9ACTN|nr:hypothetical protein [Streptomyces roseolus]MDX2290994.1 hypothetical protein [Streptomyces roseolus]
MRAEITSEMALMLGIEPQPRRTCSRLAGRWLAAWRLFETACFSNADGRTPESVERAAELVRVMVKAYESYQEYPSVGYLAWMYDGRRSPTRRRVRSSGRPARWRRCGRGSRMTTSRAGCGHWREPCSGPC